MLVEVKKHLTLANSVVNICLERKTTYHHPTSLFLAQQRRGSVCTNLQNFNGFTFGKFPCPLPAGSGMNQLDQYCCGQPNFQYCCNAQFVEKTITKRILSFSSFFIENSIRNNLVDMEIMFTMTGNVMRKLYIIHRQLDGMCRS